MNLKKIKELIYLMRPWAWFLTIFSLSIGAVFAIYPRQVTISMAIDFIFLFIVFACFIASGLYVLNDVNDVKLDRKNPSKSNRPIASGSISKREGLILSIFLLSIGCFLAYQISPIHFLLVLFLIIFQIIYSMPPFRLKETSLDFLFAGPLNHIIRFTAAWLLFMPIVEIPIVLIISLFVLYNIAYIYYKLVDKKFVPKKSFITKKMVTPILLMASVFGILLMYLSIFLSEVHFIFILCPIFLSLSFIMQLIVPHKKRIGVARSLVYSYAPIGLLFGSVLLWALILLF